MLSVVLFAGPAAADEFDVRLYKVADGKVIFQKVDRAKPTPEALFADEVTLPLANNVKVRELKFNVNARKLELAGDVPGGLEHEQLRYIDGNGLTGRIVTDNSGKVVQQIAVQLFPESRHGRLRPLRRPEPIPVETDDDPLPPRALARLGSTRFRHGPFITASAVSPDGRLIAVGGGVAIELWDAETGRVRARWPGPPYGFRRAAFSRDGRRLACLSLNRGLRIADVQTGDVLHDFSLPGGPAHSATGPWHLAFLPDGKRLIAADGSDASAHLIDATTGAEVRAFHASTPPPPTPKGGGERKSPAAVQGTGTGAVLRRVAHVALSADGQALVTADYAGTVRVWDVATGRQRLEMKTDRGMCSALAFSPDGTMLAISEMEVGLWDAKTGKRKQVLTGRASPSGKLPPMVGRSWTPAQSLHFSPDSKLLVGDYLSTAVIWDTATGKELRRFPHEMTSGVRFMPDGKTLVLGGSPQFPSAALHFLDATTGRPVRSFEGHEGIIEAVAYSPNGKYVATADSGFAGRVRVWDVATRRIVWQSDARLGATRALAFSRGGDVLAAGTGANIVLWDLHTGAVRQRLPGHRGVHLALTFSRDGRRLASGGMDGMIHVYELAGGKETVRRRASGMFTSALVFTRDARLAAASSYRDGVIRLWNLETGAEIKTIPSRGKRWLAYAADGRSLLAGDMQQLALWELASGQERLTFRLPGHLSVPALAPDARRAALGELGQMRQGPRAADPRVAIPVVDLARGRLAAPFAGHTGNATALCFSPDSRQLASGSVDTTVLLWDATTPRPAKAAPLTPAERVACWADLAGDAKRAYPSMWKLADDPGVVEFLRGELKPAPAADSKTLRRLIAELDDDSFVVREKASEQLARYGLAAAGALRQALAGKPSAELRHRAEKLLASIGGRQFRSIRAVEVLEWRADEPARQLLQALAAGAPDTELSREAKAALERLESRP